MVLTVTLIVAARAPCAGAAAAAMLLIVLLLARCCVCVCEWLPAAAEACERTNALLCTSFEGVFTAKMLFSRASLALRECAPKFLCFPSPLKARATPPRHGHNGSITLHTTANVKVFCSLLQPPSSPPSLPCAAHSSHGRRRGEAPAGGNVGQDVGRARGSLALDRELASHSRSPHRAALQRQNRRGLEAGPELVGRRRVEEAHHQRRQHRHGYCGMRCGLGIGRLPAAQPKGACVRGWGAHERAARMPRCLNEEQFNASGCSRTQDSRCLERGGFGVDSLQRPPLQH